MPDVRIADIRLNGRHRTELGDIDALAVSIDAIGLLHPVVLTPDNTLVVGQRRLEAFKRLGREAIPVHYAESLSDLHSLLRAESDENTCRKPFTPSEAVAMGESIERAYRPVAEAARRQSPGRPKKPGGSSPMISEPPRRDEEARTTAVAAKAVGMDRRTYEKAKAVIASGNSQAVAEMDRTGKVNGVYRTVRIKQAAAQIAAEPPPLPQGPFRVIVADPPWQYEKHRLDPSQRGATPYPTMTLDAIKALPVADMAANDAILWLWATNAFLPDAFSVATAWGFTYRTLLTWVKDKFGTGDWLRGQTEHCLLCVRGKPVVTLTNQSTVIHSPLREHSRKPEEFYALVEKLCPGSKVELFARERREGWHAWGNEVRSESTG